MKVLPGPAGIAVLLAAVSQTLAQVSPGLNFEHCRAITDDAARLRCYEETTSTPSSSASTPPPASRLDSETGNWRLVRTPNPSGGRNAISIMHTADAVKSDTDLAGILIRCGERDLEAMVVLVTPMPLRAQPKVTLTAAGSVVAFTGSVVPPGVEILLPNEAIDLLSGQWGHTPDLTVRVEGQAEHINGIIPLAGLETALLELRENCRSR